MSREDWKSAIARLKPGLSYVQAAEKLGQSYSVTRKWLIIFKYRRVDGRGNSMVRRNAMLNEYSGIDWRKSNVLLALECGKTRERMRQVRCLLRKPKIEARGRKAIAA